MGRTAQKVVIEFVGKDKMMTAAKRAARDVESVRERLEALGREKANPEVDAQVAGAVTRLQEVKDKLAALNGQEATPEVRAQVADAVLAFERIKAQMREIDGAKLEVKVSVRSKLGRGLSSALGSAGNIPVAGALLKNPYTAAAAVAVVTGALAQAVNTALSLGSALGAVGLAAGAVKLALDKLRLTEAGKDFRRFKKEMSQGLDDFRKIAQRNILPGLQAGIRGLLPLLRPLKSAFRTVAVSLGTAFEDLGKRLGKNNAVRRFLQTIKEQAPSAIGNLSDAIYQVIDLVAKLFNAFSGGKGKSDPIKSLTRSIRRFNESLNSAKLARFAEDVRGVARAFGFVARVASWSGGTLMRILAKGIDAAVHWRQTWAKLSGAMARVWHSITSATARAWHSIVAFVSRGVQGVNSDVSHGLATVVGFFRALPGRIVSALGDLSTLLINAGRSIMSGLASGIGDGASAVFDKVRSVASGIASAAMSALKSRSPSRVFIGIGHSIMDGLVVGIQRRWTPLVKVMRRLAAYIAKHGERLKSLIGARKGVIGDFRGMAGNVFGEDLSTTSANGVTRKPTAGSLVAYQRRQAAKAKQLLRDIRKLKRMGISDRLLRSMVNAGEGGWDNIHTLATGSVGQVRALNRADRATTAALTSAGQSVGTALYADRIQDQRREIRQAERLGKVLARVLDKHQRKHFVVEVRLEGRHLHWALLKHKRKRGGKGLALG